MSVNHRLRAFRSMKIAQYKHSNPADGADKRHATKLSDVNRRALDWGISTLGLDERKMQYCLEGEPKTLGAKAAFFGDSALQLSVSHLWKLSDVVPTMFCVPVILLDYGPSEFLGADYTSWLCSGVRFPKVEGSLVTTGDRTKPMNHVRVVETMLGMLYGAISSKGDDWSHVVLLARTIRIYCKSWTTKKRTTNSVQMAADLFVALRDRDLSTSHAAKYNELLDKMHPAEYYNALYNCMDGVDRSKVPALWQVVLGLVTCPPDVNLFGFREIILQMVLQRASKYVPSVSRRDCTSVEEISRRVSDTTARSLVPTLRHWALVADVLQVVCSNGFLSDPAGAEKRIRMYAQYHKNVMVDENNNIGAAFRSAAEDLSPAFARVADPQVLEMLAEVSSNKPLVPQQLYGGETTELQDLVTRTKSRYDKYALDGAKFAMAMIHDGGDNTPIPLLGESEHVYTKYTMQVCLQALFAISQVGNRDVYDQLDNKLDFVRQATINSIWRYCNDPEITPGAVCLRGSLKHVRPKLGGGGGPDDVLLPKRQPETAALALKFAPDDRKAMFLQAHVLSSKDECCVCFETGNKLQRCCVLSALHTVCDVCYPTIRVSNSCPFCRSEVLANANSGMTEQK